MKILEAFDLTGLFCTADELAGCCDHTGAAYVAKRDTGVMSAVKAHVATAEHDGHPYP